MFMYQNLSVLLHIQMLQISMPNQAGQFLLADPVFPTLSLVINYQETLPGEVIKEARYNTREIFFLDQA